MIFFIVSKEGGISVKPENPLEEPNYAELHKRDNFTIHAWNEIFKDRAKLLVALLRAAQKDGVCGLMRSAALCDLGFEPFTLDPDAPVPVSLLDKLNSATAANVARKLIGKWCNPRTGNIASSPKQRPSRAEEQLDAWTNWGSWTQPKSQGGKFVPFLGVQTLKAIECLMNEDLPGAGRDQARIYHNLTELARAFVGEMTTVSSKHLEKIFALGLCRSDDLWRSQVEIINLYMQKRRVEFLENVAKTPWQLFEYFNYYVDPPPDLSQDGRSKSMCEYLLLLIETSVIPPVEVTWEKYAKTPYASGMKKWKKLPPTVRCTVLINGFRKLDQLGEDVKVTRARMCLTKLPQYEEKLRQRTSNSVYKVVLGDVSRGHVPPAIGYAWNWTRNEYERTEITYRVHLCPLWGGSSRHAAGGFAHWLTVLGKDAPKGTAVTVASSLFMLWRLFYDKRISAVHTMVETFEATLSSEVTGTDKPVVNCGRKVTRMDGDAFQCVINCGQNAGKSGLLSVDPIYLVRSLQATFIGKSKWPESYFLLKKIINYLRANLAEAGYWVPQWSLATGSARGTDVKSFDEFEDFVLDESFTPKDRVTIKLDVRGPNEKLKAKL